MPDNYSQWDRHEKEQQRWLEKRPVCCHCGEYIQDENLFDINGNLYHEECAFGEFRKWTEDYES